MYEQDQDPRPFPTESQRFNDAVTDIAERRALIEQTKGMLMLVFGVDADAAFKMLRTQSQNQNVKLGVIAEQIRTILPVLLADLRLPERLAADGINLATDQPDQRGTTQRNGHADSHE